MWALKSLRSCRRDVRWQIVQRSEGQWQIYTQAALYCISMLWVQLCVSSTAVYVTVQLWNCRICLGMIPNKPKHSICIFRVLICRAPTKPAYTNEAGMRRTHWRFVQLLKCSAQSLHWDSNLWPWQCYCLALPTEPLQSILIKAHVSKTEYSHPHGNTEVKAAANREVFLNIKVILFVSLLLFSGSLAFKKLIMAPAELSAAWLSAASRKAK